MRMRMTSSIPPSNHVPSLTIHPLPANSTHDRHQPATMLQTTSKPDPRFSIMALSLSLCLLLLLLHITSATAHLLPSTILPNLHRQTALNDLLGHYTLHPDSYLSVSNASCPIDLTFETFHFTQSGAPASIEAPSNFNIQIPHTSTGANGRDCTSSASIHATTSSHPFVTNATAVVAAWAGAGRASPPAPWLWSNLTERIASHAWAVGYDFVPRSCRGTIVPNGAAYLWYQPPYHLRVSDHMQLQHGQKYMLLTFPRAGRSRGCIYIAKGVGGTPGYAPGPVSDPTNPEGDANPNPHSPYPSASPVHTPEPSEDPIFSPEASPPPIAAVQPAQGSLAPASSSVFGPGPNTDGGAGGEQEESSSQGGPACFPSSATVVLHDGRIVSMARLMHGDRVRVSHASSSPVFFFSHRMHGDVLQPFLNVSTASGASIVLSAEHYLPLMHGRLMAARGVRPLRDGLLLADGTVSLVTHVRPVLAVGLHAPHTLHGEIVVNGVVASTYTTAVHPSLAHYVLLRPVRWLYRVGGVGLFDKWFTKGAPLLASALPSGPESMRRVI